MTFIKNILAPITAMVVSIGFTAGIGWVIYRFIKNKCPNIKYWIKYKMFRRKYNEEVVSWCMTILDNKQDHIYAEKELLVNAIPPNEIKEILYIFREITKLEGGNTNE